MHTLLIADDHPMFREAMADAIAAALPGTTILQAATLAQTLQDAAAHEEIDLLLLDLSLPDSAGLDGLARLREQLPWLPVAIISAEQARETVLEALNLGAVGYIPKSTPRQELLAALQQVLEGRVYLPAGLLRRPSLAPRAEATETPGLTPLTAKQREVLVRMSQGKSNKHIARELMIAETTVKTHVSAILGKLGVSSRVQAILAAREQHLAPSDESPVRLDSRPLEQAE